MRLKIEKVKLLMEPLLGNKVILSLLQLIKGIFYNINHLQIKEILQYIGK